MNRNRRVLLVLVIGVLSFAGLTAVALSGTAVPDDPRPLWRIDEIRWLAKGPHYPTHVEAVSVAESRMPAFVLRAGAGYQMRPLAMYSFRIAYDDHHHVVDAINDAATQASFVPWADHFAAGYDLMQTWMATADRIVFTHEHFDHCAGAAHAPNFDAIADRLWMPEAQLDNETEMRRAGFSPEQRAKLRRLPMTSPMRFDDGVVLVPTPGHTPGSLSVYVHLQDGRELMFIGDIVWSGENIDLRETRPKLPEWVVGSSPSVMAEQVGFLHEFRKEHPEVRLVVAHDGGEIAALAADGLLRIVQ